jgi:2-oxoglutarate dehydrogenase E2 component (dihydrolipoamide succinyltransferase)
MSLINTIFAPTESVNDQYLSIISILVKSGDFVKKEDLIAELESSKALLEVRADLEGYIQVLIDVGNDVKVGEKLFNIFDDLNDIKNFISENREAENLIYENVRIKNDEVGIPIENKNIKFSEKAKIYIESSKLNINKLNIVNYITSKSITPKNDEVHNKKQTKIDIAKEFPNSLETTSIPLSKSKKVEFDYLYSVNSSSVISRLAIKVDVYNYSDIGNSQNFIKSTPLPSIINEVSKLLLKYPNLNSYFTNNNQAFYNQVNIGFAIDDGIHGLKVATIFNTDKLELNTIEEEISNLSMKYSANQLNTQDLSSMTFTITDLFNSNVIHFSPLVNLNNAAILGISSFINDGFIIDLSFDHRLTNGKEVSIFLGDLKFRLESRFNQNKIINSQNRDGIKCIKCNRDVTDDYNGDIYFQKIKNSKYDGYICTVCLNGI